MQALALICPKVIIWVTLSLPYFPVTYLITSSLFSKQKSMSISGRLILSGFRNLSKRRLYLIGSRLVIPRDHATRLPAADPLPGPTGMSLLLAYSMKSVTIRKYPGNPIPFMTFSSLASLSK